MINHPGQNPFAIAFIVLSVALAENLLMADHASNYTYDRLKAVQLLALFLAWGAMCSRKMAAWIFSFSVMAGLCSLGIFLRIYDTPGGWSYFRQAEQKWIGDIIMTTASTNGPAFFNGDVRGAEVYYAQRDLVETGLNADSIAFAREWCRKHHFPEGTVYEISGHYPFSDPKDLPRSVTIRRVYANGGLVNLGQIQLSEQAGDYHSASYANHPFHNWRRLRPVDILKILIWQ